MPIRTVSGEVKVFVGNQNQVNKFFEENQDLEIQDIQLRQGVFSSQILVIYRPED